MIRKSWIVSSYSTRPAGPPDKCFYCGAAVGTEHNNGCVIRSKTVIMDYTFRLCVDIPEDWDTKTSEFCRGGGSSYCCDNVISLIEYAAEKMGCSCGFTTPVFVRDATELDEQLYPIRWDKDHLEESISDSPSKAQRTPKESSPSHEE